MYNIWDFNPIDGPHIVQMSFQLPYLDWCRFEHSKLFHDLTEYLMGLGKQDIQNEQQENQEKTRI